MELDSTDADQTEETNAAPAGISGYGRSYSGWNSSD